MSLPTTFLSLLSERGIPMLDAFGTADVSLTAEDAVSAAQSLTGEGVAILGGDVFYSTPEGFELAFANWHSDPRAGESAAIYAARSIEETCEYIRRYPLPPPNKVPLFSLVVAQVF